MKRFAVLSMTGALLLSLVMTGCNGGAQEASEPDYADDEVISAMADGLEKRFDIADDRAESGEPQTAETFTNAVQAEIDALNSFRSREFKDSELQESVISYINLLNDCVELTEKYPVDTVEFYDAWNELYQERVVALRGFVENYGLKLDGEYEVTLDEMMVEANAAVEKDERERVIQELVDTITFSQTDDGYGFYTYSATVQNTTGYNLSNVGFVLGLYDADGVRAEETYANVNSWPDGETVALEAFGETDASQIKVELDYYDIKE